MDKVLLEIGKEIRRLQKEDPAKLAEVIESLNAKEAEDLYYTWEIWARPNQLVKDEWPESIILYSAGRGFGKALDVETPVPTPTGWTTMGALKKGDTVYDEKGKECKVLVAYEPFVSNEVYRIKFSDGTSLDACKDHLWVTLTALERKQLNTKNLSIPTNWAKKPSISTKEMVKSLKKGKRGDTNHCIPVCGYLKAEEKQLVIEPYSFGYWLGDGDSAGAVITTADEEIVDFFKEDGYIIEDKGYETSGKAKRYYVDYTGYKRNALGQMTDNGSFCSKLKRLNVYKNKHIPKEYFRASYKQRLALLQGLVDSDGYVKDSKVEFCTTNEQLAYDFLELARTLGEKPVLSKGRAKLYGKDCGPKYRVTYRATQQPAKLSRKVKEWKPFGSQYMRNTHRMVIGAEKIEPTLVRCITVDSPNSMYLAGEGFIPTHNSRLGSEWVRKKALKHKSQIALVGPTSADTRDVMVLGPSGIIAVHPPKDRPKYEPSYARLTWPNGTTAKMYSAEKSDRLRGGNNEYIWFDELGAMEDRDVFDQAMLTLRIGESKALGTTTPRKGNEIMLELWKRAVFNDDPPDPNKDVRIITGSTYENADNLSKLFMNQIVASYKGSRLGNQEIEGMMLFDNEGALWNTELLDKCRVEEEPDDIKLYAIGVDPQAKKKRNSDSTGIIGACIDDVDRGYVLHDLTGNYSPSEWATRVVSLYDEYSKKGPCVIVVENNQGGDMVVETLGNVRKNLPVKTTFSTSDKLSRAMPVAILYEQSRIFHVKTFTELEEEMCTYDGSGKSPNRLDALVFAMNHLMATNRNVTKIMELLL